MNLQREYSDKFHKTVQLLQRSLRHALPAITLLLFAGQIVAQDRTSASDVSVRTDVIYQTNYLSNTVEVFTLRGKDLGTFAMPSYPTGLAFDKAGNLYVSSDDPAEYAIDKFTPDGSMSIFANQGLAEPHALAFDKAGRLYVVNTDSSTIVKFTSDGSGTIFADVTDGLQHPIDLVFDRSGNLFVTNAFGGTAHKGSVVKITPDGTGSVFADGVFNLAFGIALDRAGDLYVSNFNDSTIVRFAPDGTYLGVFASAGLNAPHGMVFDREGNLYVANNGNDSIEKFSPTGEDLGLFAHTGQGPHFLAILKPRH